MRGAVLGSSGAQRRVYPYGAEGDSTAFCARAPGCYMASAAPSVAPAPRMRRRAPGVLAAVPAAEAMQVVPPPSAHGGLVTG
jgi:hypothetical protein